MSIVRVLQSMLLTIGTLGVQNSCAWTVLSTSCIFRDIINVAFIIRGCRIKY